jgi:hypothetical protein
VLLSARAETGMDLAGHWLVNAWAGLSMVRGLHGLGWAWADLSMVWAGVCWALAVLRMDWALAGLIMGMFW